MSRRLRLATAVLLLLLPAATSCRWFRKPKPIPRPAQIPVQTEPAKPAPPAPLEPPPGIPTAEPEAGGIPGAEPQPLPLPPPPPAKTRPSPAGPRVTTAPPEPVETPPVTATPQLRPVLTPAQRQELERSIDERIRRTRSILASIGARSLRGEQGNLARQVWTFLKQAEEARGTDLLRANNLAERAEVLAQDLAKRLR